MYIVGIENELVTQWQSKRVPKQCGRPQAYIPTARWSEVKHFVLLIDSLKVYIEGMGEEVAYRSDAVVEKK